MYLFEKRLGRIVVSELKPDMAKVIVAKEKEVYGKLDYLKMLKAVNGFEDDILLKSLNPQEMGVYINWNEDGLGIGEFHYIEEDLVSDDIAFANLQKIINTPILKCVKYQDNSNMHFIALTDPYYNPINDYDDITEIKNIVPISEKLYEINHLMELLQNGTLDNLYKDIPREYMEEFCSFLVAKEVHTPNMWYSALEELHKYGIVPGSNEDFAKRMEFSKDILSRVRSK